MDPSFSEIFGSNKKNLTPRCVMQCRVRFHAVLASAEFSRTFCPLRTESLTESDSAASADPDSAMYAVVHYCANISTKTKLFAKPL